MDDQKQKKLKPTKQVRVRVTYSARIEVVDENENPVDGRCIVQPIEPFDERGFKEAYDFIDIARQAKEIEIEQEFEQQQKQKLESEKNILQSAISYVTSFLN